ncbi:uncharacterized protein LOC129742291 [Uranotaenia lowii]|uniref:uncharacterized protein LOC129742291 n=1 Tax=Uranotaenia lowii TaxID=190385 RepID=UPI00247A6F8A|nr:uncharacterized protein LOC129742291 [Uranotaenia lowii]
MFNSTIDNHAVLDQVVEAELKIVAWAVENNISFSAVDKLMAVINQLDPGSVILQKMKLGRTKTTAVVEGVFAETQHAELVATMKRRNFSLLIDESTDLTNKKTLAMVVRICLETLSGSLQVRDMIYKVLEISAADHKTIFDAIVAEFEKDGIDYRKLLKGFGSDGAAVMMGSKHSVMALLKKECPDIVVIKCSCHSLALCASHACEKLPNYAEQLLRDIYSYISNSPKRASEFSMIQEILELKPLKMLHPAATRWLSLESVVKRVLERFEELELFFSFQSNNDQNATAKRILNHLQDPMTKLILFFLSYILPLINNLNRLFQSESPEYTSIHQETMSFFMTLIRNVCHANYITQANDFFDNFENHLKPDQEVYVGIAVEEAIKSVNGRAGFPLIKSFLSNIFMLPHSSAAVERIFSQFNANKTKVRNRINIFTFFRLIFHCKYLFNEDAVSNPFVNARRTATILAISSGHKFPFLIRHQQSAIVEPNPGEGNL